MQQEGPKPHRSKRLIFGMVAGIAVVAIGVIAICFHLIDTLQEQSAAMRKFQVKPTQAIETKTLLKDESDYFESVQKEDAKVWKKQPESSQSCAVGDTLKNSNNFKDALVAYERSLAQYKQGQKRLGADPQDTDELRYRYERISECYSRLRKFPQALTACNEAIAISPDRAHLFVNRAYVYVQLGQQQKANADQKHADELGPDEEITQVDWMVNMGKGDLHKKD